MKQQQTCRFSSEQRQRDVAESTKTDAETALKAKIEVSMNDLLSKSGNFASYVNKYDADLETLLMSLRLIHQARFGGITSAEAEEVLPLLNRFYDELYNEMKELVIREH